MSINARHRMPWRGIPQRLADVGTAFARNRRGATAVEFALVGSMLIMSIMFVAFIGLLLYFNQALDYATMKSARQIMTGTVQKAAMSQSDFRTKVVCSYLPAAINCNDVIINVQTVTEARQPLGYYSFVKSDMSGLVLPTLSNGSAQFNIGIQASYVYLQVIYPVTFLPSFLNNLMGGTTTYNGLRAYLTISTAAFRNEQY